MSDQPSPAPKSDVKGPALRPFAEFVHAMKFLTRLPVPFSKTIDPPPLNQTMRMFSVAGAVVGLMISVVLLAAQIVHLPPTLSAILAVAAGVLVTGALHEDGFADTADGFGGGKTREHRLDIMRDSRIGSYGALALTIAIAARVAAYASLTEHSALALLTVIVAAQSFSRALVVDLMWATPPARTNGLSAYAGQPQRSVAMFAIAVGLVLTLVAGYFNRFENAILALALGLAATAAIRWQAMRLIGGQTGDVCGAAQIACEVMMLAAFLAILH